LHSTSDSATLRLTGVAGALAVEQPAKADDGQDVKVEAHEE
jgi:hypothetical protein